MKQPSYYAIIPAQIRYDSELTPNAKLLYGEITSLCNQQGYCWASNNYFAELYKVSKTSISKWINSLKHKNYIEVKIQYKEGTKEIVKRTIQLTSIPIEDNFKPPIEDKFIGNITSINNKNDISVDWSNLLLLFNNITKKQTKVLPEKAKKQIRERLREGWTKDDIKKAIKNCYNDEHHINTKHKYCTLELISRAEKFERFATMTTNGIHKSENETDEERVERLTKETKEQ
jgi:uncharacterized phage protein (TIGR02220 family)